MKLSILIPVYNERTLVERSLRGVLDAPLPENMTRELVVVDDCSTDGTLAILDRLAEAEPRIRLFRHPVNQGKGAAVRTAVQQATGEFCLIQDADLEYDPNDYPALLRPLLDGDADAVFGSRYLAGERRRVLPYRHSRINSFLTWFSNVFSNLDLTDMETCYKVFRTDLLKSIPIRSNRFGIEPELTIKCAKRQLRIYETPISYHGRSYEEGKKIGWKDGFRALGVVLRFWLIDDLYMETYGRAHLNNLTGTPQYVNWIVSLVRPHLGDSVWEAGAGIGTLTGRLMVRRLRYVASERDPLYLHALQNRFLRTPTVEIRPHDRARAPGEQFDTVLCLNQLEYSDDPAAALRSAAEGVRPGGALVVLVPQGAFLYGSVDRTMGHKRRFSAAELSGLLGEAGLTLESQIQLNRISTLAWLLSARLFRVRRMNKLFLKIFDKTVWLWRLLDPIIPWPGLSLIAVARKQERQWEEQSESEEQVERHG